MHVLAIAEEHGAIFESLGMFDGILGLARSTDPNADADKFSFTRNLQKARTSDAEVFSLRLGEDSGNVSFGVGVELKEGFGRFELVGDDFWIIPGLSIHGALPVASDSKAAVDADTTQGFKVVLDSGTIDTALPPHLFKKLGTQKEFILTVKGKDKVYKLKIKPQCEFIELDLTNTSFAGAVVLGQSFFVGREVRFGPTWVDIQLIGN
jgi:hypothetical protein